MKKLLARAAALPSYVKYPSLICLLLQFAAYYLPLFFGRSTVRTLSSALDDSIPLIPVFTFIYVAAYAFWVWSYFTVFKMGPRMARRLLTADVLCKVVCVLCFCLYPCTLVRPEPVTGFAAWALRIVYFFDKPTNLLPSMHCYLSWMCARAFLSRHASGIRPGLKAFSVVFALLICLSTLFTKQHVVVDVVTGVALAEAAWLIAGGVWGKQDDAKESPVSVR